MTYEQLVTEHSDDAEYRSQLDRLRLRLSRARASLPNVVPSQDKVVSIHVPDRTAGSSAGVAASSAPAKGPEAAAAGGAGAAARGAEARSGKAALPLHVTFKAPGAYRYTTLEDTLKLLKASRMCV